ncbi:MAG: glycosyltransferase family 9 protein [Candidatus Omnitrophica bacterium]|nr:glycosyltransferase family 9 protein [Candidatus Omnitrophota bacterium]
MVNTILINFPTNLGDAIMSLPVLDRLKANYPKSKITAIVSLQTREFLLRNNFIDEIVVFDKLWRIREKKRFAFSFRGKYDLVVDLKNSFLPIIVGAKLRTPYFRKFPKNMHIADKNLALIKKIAKKEEEEKSDFSFGDESKSKWDNLGITSALFIACSSRSLLKRYSYFYLRKVVEDLAKIYPVAILGEKGDREFYGDILSLPEVIDLVGQTTMVDVFYLLKNYARLLLGVDSSVTHLGSYLNVPIVSIFGPTHPGRSYPKSDKSVVLTNKSVSCAPCEKATCDFNYECMKIEPGIIIDVVKNLLS